MFITIKRTVRSKRSIFSLPWHRVLIEQLPEFMELICIMHLSTYINIAFLLNIMLVLWIL